MKEQLKISIKEGDYTITFTSPSNSFTPEIIARMITESRKCIKIVKANENKVMTETEATNPAPVQVIHKKEEPVENNDFKIRKRLPNNVIDPSKLSINTKTGESAMVRCPSCGQSHVAIVKAAPEENYLMIYDNKKKDFVFVGKGSISYQDVVNMTLTYEEGKSDKDYYKQKRDFYDDLQTLLKGESVEKDVCVYDDTLIQCPVCGENDKFSVWKTAYYSPLEYNEYENICLVCGGEMLEKLDKKSKKGIALYKCDNCGFEKEKKVEVSQ